MKNILGAKSLNFFNELVYISSYIPFKMFAKLEVEKFVCFHWGIRYLIFHKITFFPTYHFINSIIVYVSSIQFDISKLCQQSLLYSAVSDGTLV